MIPLARIGDACQGICSHPDHVIPIPMTGRIVTCSPTMVIENKNLARMGDIVMGDCTHIGTIIKGSSTMFADGRPVAKLGDTFSGDFSGTIITCSSKTSAV